METQVEVQFIAGTIEDLTQFKFELHFVNAQIYITPTVFFYLSDRMGIFFFFVFPCPCWKDFLSLSVAFEIRRKGRVNLTEKTEKHRQQ